MKISNNLKLFREKAGLTQEEFAKQVGITRPSVSLIEQGKRKVSVAEFVKFCGALGCSYEELIGEVSKSEKKEFKGNESAKDLLDFYKQNYGQKRTQKHTRVNPLDEYLGQVNPYCYPSSSGEIRYER